MRAFALSLIAVSLLAAGSDTVQFLGRPYRLASVSQKGNPMWEFTSQNESVENWTTLLTIVDRPDAKSKADLDRLAQGVMDTYKGNGGKILMARTMVDGAGKPFNYMVVAFDQPAKKRFELSFAKVAMVPANAVITVYGVHVTDAKDYVGKAKAFLNEHSAEIGKELEKAALPVVAALPRR